MDPSKFVEGRAPLAGRYGNIGHRIVGYGPAHDTESVSCLPAYDALGRVTQVTFPSTLTESYAYDAMNNLLSKTGRKQQTTGYGYDALYRLTRKAYPGQTAVGRVADVA